MEPFIHKPEYRVIISQSCQYAVLPSEVDIYLAREKHKISGPKRRVIEVAVMAASKLIYNEEQLQEDFIIPQPDQAPIAGIPVYSNGLACTFNSCRFVCRNKKHISENCQGEHLWVNPYPRGGSIRQRRSHTYPWRENVYCQRFFTYGPRQEYFEVAPQAARSPDETDASSPGTVAQNVAQKGQGELERIIQKQEEIASQQAIARPEQMSDANAWLERVEWAYHLAGFTFEEMIAWAELPRDDEIQQEENKSSEKGRSTGK